MSCLHVCVHVVVFGVLTSLFSLALCNPACSHISSSLRWWSCWTTSVRRLLVYWCRAFIWIWRTSITVRVTVSSCILSSKSSLRRFSDRGRRKITVCVCTLKEKCRCYCPLVATVCRWYWRHHCTSQCVKHGNNICKYCTSISSLCCFSKPFPKHTCNSVLILSVPVFYTA